MFNNTDCHPSIARAPKGMSVYLGNKYDFSFVTAQRVKGERCGVFGGRIFAFWIPACKRASLR